MAGYANARSQLGGWRGIHAGRLCGGAVPFLCGLAEQSIRALRADDARAWHAAHVRRAPCVLAVVGDVDPAEVARLLASAFAALEFAPPRPPVVPVWPNGIVQHAESRDKAQTALALAFPGPSRRDASRVSAALIAGVASGLGGRFFDQLRDKQSVGAGAGSWAASSGMSPLSARR